MALKWYSGWKATRVFPKVEVVNIVEKAVERISFVE
jgi:hypothetical protein